MRVNCSGQILSIHHMLEIFLPPENPHFRTQFYLEAVILATTSVTSSMFLFLILSIRVWHTNLNILMVTIGATTLISNISHICVMVDSFTEENMGICTLKIEYGTLVLLIYVILFGHGVISLLVERYFAYYFITDYEKRRRRIIPITLLLISSTIAILITTAIRTRIIDKNTNTIYSCFLTVFAASGFVSLWFLNKRRMKKVVHATNVVCYTLSCRFQLIENLRVLSVLRNMFTSAIISGGLVCSIQILTGRLYPNEEIYIPANLSLCQSVTLIVGFCSVEKWREYLISIFRPHKTRSDVNIQPTKNSGDLYFQQLQKSWVI